MTEAEWLASGEAYQPLVHVRAFASIQEAPACCRRFCSLVEDANQDMRIPAHVRT